MFSKLGVCPWFAVDFDLFEWFESLPDEASESHTECELNSIV